jgi:hypothetical protein
MPMLPVQSLPPLVLVTLLLFAASLYGLAALGHFPRATRQQALLEGSGPLVLWGSIAAVAASVAVAVVAAWQTIPWYAAIIGGGAAILIAPLALQYFSDRFVDGRRALLLFSGATLVLAAGLLCYIDR